MTGKEKMSTHRKTAIIVGVLFIIGTAAGIISKLGAFSILSAPDYLVNASANENQITRGAIAVLIMGLAIAPIPAILFPILKKHNESLALGYVVFRTLEVITFFVATVSYLSLLALSQEYVKAGAPDASYFQTLGAFILKADDSSGKIGMIVFTLSALILNYIFYKSKLIPRWLSGWGLVGATLHLVEGLLGMMFGPIAIVSVLESLVLPGIGLQEMVYAVWLIVKGFDPSVIASLSAKQN